MSDALTINHHALSPHSIRALTQEKEYLKELERKRMASYSAWQEAQGPKQNELEAMYKEAQLELEEQRKHYHQLVRAAINLEAYLRLSDGPKKRESEQVEDQSR